MRTSFLLGASLAAAMLAGTGCSQMRTAPSETDFYTATLSAAQEVPTNPSAGTGAAEVQVNRGSGMLQWRITYSGLTGPVTAGHIHGPAGPGQNAGVLVPFTGDLNAQPITGAVRITPEQMAQLSSGQWYVNLHTARHPGGEIRGQLRPR